MLRTGAEYWPGPLRRRSSRQQGEKLCRDLYGFDVDHTGIYTAIDRINEGMAGPVDAMKSAFLWKKFNCGRR